MYTALTLYTILYYSNTSDDPNPDGKRDFNKINFTVTFNPGDLLTKTITTENLLIDDNINEAEEAFLLLLEIVDSGSNETVIQDVLIFRIRNDDGMLGCVCCHHSMLYVIITMS